MKFTKQSFVDLLYIPISLVFLFIMFRNYTQFLDISMVDETGYMELLNFNPFLYPGGYGPLYIISYKILYQFIHDFVNLHYFAIISLTWLPSVVLFYFLRSRRVTYFVAFYFSWAFMFTSYIAAFDWWSRTAHYSIAFIFMMFIFTKNYNKQVIKQLLFFILLARILAYVRPELAVTSYGLIGLLFLYVLYTKVYKKQKLNIVFSKFEKFSFSILLIVFLGMFLIWKSPTTNTGRMYFALGQHYKFNTMLWNHQERKEFLHWEETFKAQFGDSKTFLEMYKNNPKETIKHVSFNIQHYIHQTFEFIPELFLPKVIFKFNYLIKWLLIILVYIGLVFIVGWNNYWRYFKIVFSEHFVSIFIALAFALPSVMASFVIYPREHYFIMQLVFIVYLLYLLFMPIFKDFKVRQNIQVFTTLGLFILLVFISSNVQSYTRYNNFYTYKKPNYLPYIQTIRAMDIDTTVNFLSFEILPVYLGKNFKGHAFFSKQPFYDSLIVAQQINMMYISDVIIEDKRNKVDSSFNYFMNNYKILGWKKFQLKDKWGYLIYKNELDENRK